jgi:hypothetical protein
MKVINAMNSMNKVKLVVAGLLIAISGMMMTSCEKEALKGIVTYTVDRPNDITSQVDGQIKFLDVFIVSVTYKDAAGKLVTVSDVQLPWKFTAEVEAPFMASIDVNITLRQLAKPLTEFPRPNGNLTKITIESGGKRLSEGYPAPGTGSGLYSNVNEWLSANGHVSYSLNFTAETLDKNGSAS